MGFMRSIPLREFSISSRGANPSVLRRLSALPSQVPLSPLQTQTDEMVSRFLDETVSPTTLAAMAAGGMAYRLGRIGMMGVGSSAIIRPLSFIAGLGSEVTAFEFTSRIFQTLHQSPVTNHQSPNLWSWSGPGGWGEGLSTSAVTFGMLRGAGFLAREENIVLQHAIQGSAMVAGHHTASLLGLTPRPEGSFAQQFLHAGIVNLQMSAGMGLVQGVAPGIHAWERGLDWSLQSETNGMRWGGRTQGPPLPQFSGIGAGIHGEEFIGNSPEIPDHVLMSTGGEGGGGDGPRYRKPLLKIIRDRIIGTEETPEKVIEFDLESRRLIRDFESMMIQVVDRGEESVDKNLMREELQTLLIAMARTPLNSEARKHLVDLPRPMLTGMLNYLQFFDPPLPPQSPPIHLVGKFMLLPELRHFLQEVEARRSHGVEFIRYEHLKKEDVSVTQIDSNGDALFLRTHVILRPVTHPPLTRGSRGAPPGVKTTPKEVFQENLERALSTLPLLRRKYPHSPILRLDLDVWPSRALLVDRRALESLLQSGLETLITNPSGKAIPRVKIFIFGKSEGWQLDYRRGKDNYIQELPDPF